ncbi:MAG: allophanate hydrolase, partial [Roseateles sp.]
PVLMRQRGGELVSHGVLPGVVQVPASGQPIVLLADAPTTGGYPIIAIVIRADLWKLAQMPLGAALRFQACTQQDAITAWREQQRLLAGWRNAL